MAIKKESIIAMATALKLDMTAFNAALAATDEQEVKLPEGTKVFTTTDLTTHTVLNQAELTSRDETIKNSAQKAGKEFAVKEMKEAAGLDYDGEGSKDPKRFVTEYQKKVLKDANITETDKIKELNGIIEGLRTNITTLTAEKETMITTTKRAQSDNDLLTMTIDKKPDNLSNAQWLAVLKTDVELADQDGAQVIKIGGKVAVNKTDLKPLPAKDAVIGYIDERKIGKTIVTPAGPGPHRAAGDSKITAFGITTLKQFNAHLKEQNINANGDQAKAMLKEITDVTPNFDYSTKE